MRPAPSGRQPYRSRRGNGDAPAGAPKGFPLALWKPSDAKVGKKPMGRQIPLPRRSRRANPPYPLYSHPSSNGFISRKCSLWNSNNPSSRR